MMKKLLILLAISPLLQLNAQSWEQKQSLPDEFEGRNHPITFALDGYGYILTGNGNRSSERFDDFYRYDPVTDEWTQLPDFPGGRRGYAYGVTNNGKAYVGFGSVREDGSTTYYGDLWRYDPQTEEWTELATCPGPARNHPALIALDSTIHLGLGNDGDGDMNDWWEYNINTDTWTQMPDFPSTERHHPYYFGIDGIAYVGFGHHSMNIFNDFYKFDPVDTTWTRLSDLPGEERVAGTQFDYNGKGYLLSGQGVDHENLDTGEFWQYDPLLDQWDSLTPHPGSGRWAPGTFVIGDVVYMTCGESNDGQEKDMWAYDFSILTTRSDKKPTVNIYPNPVEDKVNIMADSDIESVELFNISGQQVMFTQLNAPTRQYQYAFPDLERGVYFLSLRTQQGMSTVRLVKR